MPVAEIAGRTVTVDDEGFMLAYEEWDETLAAELASSIGVEMDDAKWAVIRFLREDFAKQGVTPTLRRVSMEGGASVKELFQMFPKKPAKKMSYIAGLPKPAGCV